MGTVGNVIHLHEAGDAELGLNMNGKRIKGIPTRGKDWQRNEDMG